MSWRRRTGFCPRFGRRWHPEEPSSCRSSSHLSLVIGPSGQGRGGWSPHKLGGLGRQSVSPWTLPPELGIIPAVPYGPLQDHLRNGLSAQGRWSWKKSTSQTELGGASGSVCVSPRPAPHQEQEQAGFAPGDESAGAGPRRGNRSAAAAGPSTAAAGGSPVP